MSRIDYTSSDVHRSLWRISAPMLALSVLDYLLIFVNLGWLMIMSDEQYLPATFRIATSIVGVLEAAFGGVLGAVYIYANQRFGNKDNEAAQHLINLGFGLAIALGLLIAFFGHLFASQMLAGFAVDETVRTQTLRYLEVYWYGYVAVIVHLYGGLIAKMSGDLQVIVQFKLATFAANLVATPVFILVAIQRHMDALQATALALILARLLGLLILGMLLWRGKVFPFRLGVHLAPRRVFTQWRDLSKLAAAETVNGVSLTLSFLLFLLIISHFDAAALHAVTVAQYMTGFIQAILLGAVTALIPFVAQNAGQRNIDNIASGVRWMTKRALSIAAALGLVYMLLAPSFVHIFVSDPAISKQTVDYIRITTLPWALLMASFPFIFAVVGLGDTRGTLILTVWSMYIGNLIPLLLVLNFVGDSVVLAASAEAASHVLAFLGCLVYYKRKERQLVQSWGNTPPARFSARDPKLEQLA